MKKLVTLLAAFAAGNAFAQDAGYLGTKVSGTAAAGGATAPGGVGSFIQMVMALGIVLVLLKTVAPKIIGKLNKRIVTTATSTINIEETACFAGGTLYVIHAKAKTLLVCCSSSGVTCLADLTETTTPAPEIPSFQEIVESAKPYDPSSAVVTTEPSKDVEAALQRLERLAR